MPLPKLPTRPAAILTFPSGESARAQARSTKTAAARSSTQAVLAEDNEDELLVQPELEGLAAPARKAQIPAPARQVPPPAPAAPAARAETRRAKPAPAKRTKARAQNEPRKLFVLDTNVLLHDPSSLFRFEEHDIFLPMMTLEELDHQKKGMSEVARNARQVSR
jgi:PhoH-like ATPase